MREVYRPDNWVLVRIPNSEGSFYKVLAGWSGGYLDGNSWRLNSGVTRLEETYDCYYFFGQSGSEYQCRKAGEEVRENILHVLKALEDRGCERVLTKGVKWELIR